MLEIAYNSNPVNEEKSFEVERAYQEFQEYKHEAQSTIHELTLQLQQFHHALENTNSRLSKWEMFVPDLVEDLQQVLVNHKTKKEYQRLTEVDVVGITPDFDSILRINSILEKVNAIQEPEQEPLEEKKLPEVPNIAPTRISIREKPASARKSRIDQRESMMKVLECIPTTKKAIQETRQLNKELEDGWAEDVQVEPVVQAEPVEEKLQLRNVAVQTKPLPFDADKIKPSQLLGQLRPWGPPSMSLPRRGFGLYQYQKFQVFSPKHQYYVPNPPQLSNSLLHLLEPTKSTQLLKSSTSSSSSF
jgi:hypothetical protein